MRLVQRRTLWWPTWKGWLLLCGLILLPPIVWGIWGERYLAASSKAEGAEVLVVEGWIGRVALAGAAEEFEQGGYEKIIATGCWSEERDWSFAQVAARELKRQGIDPSLITEVPLGKVDRQRTYETAKAVAAGYAGNGAINVFTRGPHARRSGAVYRKVFPEEIRVGRIGWWSPEDKEKNWWDSSSRTKEFMTESVGYWIETLFDGGR